MFAADLQAEYEGLFAIHVRIRPWEWDLLDLDQAYRMVATVDALNEQ